MDTLTFTMSDLAHRTGEVASAADRGPVMLTRHKRERYVLLRVEDYERVTARAVDPRHVGRTREMPPELRDLFFEGVADRSLSDLPLVSGTTPYDPAYEPRVLEREVD